MAFSKINRRAKIKRRIRKRITGTSKVPRLTVFRSNKQIYAQLVDDVSGKTLASASTFKNKAVENMSKSDQSSVIGKEVAEKAIKVGIESVVFDRNGYLYHGRVKSLANSAREAGLKF
jgi:large subunit ribosomal protein L18